jgi:nucleoside-diphosphate-sugar epimerase
MKILIAGASGAIGRPLVSRLVGAGHDVIGITSSEHGLQTIKENGAKGVVANALDAQAVRLAMNDVHPDAVIDELTSLPKHYTPEEMRAAAIRDRTIRLEGGGNLYNAARVTGSPVLLARTCPAAWPGPHGQTAQVRLLTATFPIWVLSVAAALFLLSEMYSPYSGVARLYGEPLRLVLEQLSQ